MNRNLVEFVGAFFLVLTVGMVTRGTGAGSLGPLAVGSVLAVMVYAGGPISGAHYNPAVTFAVWLRGKLKINQAVAYWIAQLLGAVVASLVVGYLTGGATAAMELDAAPALVAEFVFTFALVYVILHVATSTRAEGNQYFGLAIGFTLMVGAFAVGPISGGVFNPAVALGVTLMGISAVANLWIYLVATLLAAALAVAVFRLTDAEG